MTENQRTAAQLSEVRRDDGWWITGWEPEMGPYETRAEAKADRTGVQRFLRHEQQRGYVSTADSGCDGG